MNNNNYNNKSGLLIKSSRLEINAIFIVAIFLATIDIKKLPVIISIFTSLITQTAWELNASLRLSFILIFWKSCIYRRGHTSFTT